MSGKIDEETILDEVERRLKEELNNKIDEINQEKNDSIVLSHVDENAYIAQSLDDFPMNYDPFIYYGIEDSETVSQEGAVAEMLPVEIDIVIQGNDDTTIQKKLLRYRRALREVFVEDPYRVGRIITSPKISSLAPISLKLKNSSYPFKVIGIILETEVYY